MTNSLISADISIFYRESANFSDVIISVHDVTSKMLSLESNYIVHVVVYPQLCDKRFYERCCQKDLTKKIDQIKKIFKRCSWLKLNKLGLSLGINLKFYIGVTIWLKRKVRMFWQLTSTFVEVIGEKLLAGLLIPPVLCCCLFKFLGRNHFLQ